MHVDHNQLTKVPKELGGLQSLLLDNMNVPKRSLLEARPAARLQRS